MKILAFSDWRTQSFQMLLEMVRQNNPDIVLYAGDDIKRLISPDRFIFLKTSNHLLKLQYPSFQPVIDEDKKIMLASARKLLRQLQPSLNQDDITKAIAIPFYYVNGNDDDIIFENGTYYLRFHVDDLVRLTEYDEIVSVIVEDKGRIKAKEILLPPEIIHSERIAYSDTSLCVPINPAYGNFDIPKRGEQVSVFGVSCSHKLDCEINESPTRYSDILLSHLPPFGVLDLSTRFGVQHVGSKKLLRAIRKFEPKLVICGHSHMWGGNISHIGKTTVINVSSHDSRNASGNYALIDTKDWSVQLKQIEPEDSKRSYYLPGMKRIRRALMRHSSPEGWDLGNRLWQSNGQPSTELLDKIDGLDLDTTRIRERIQSRHLQKPRIKKAITINPETHAFIDVETGQFHNGIPGKLWLIGMWHDNKLKQFTIPKQTKEFLDYLKDAEIGSLTSWTKYDRDALSGLLKKAKMQIKFIDACQRARNCVVWHSYKLQDLHHALYDSELKEELISGDKAGLYADHLIIPNKTCKYCPPKSKLIKQIKEKNEMDIRLMIEICNKLRNV